MEEEIQKLKIQLELKEQENRRLKEILKIPNAYPCTYDVELESRTSLTNAEIGRYSRQLILPEIGVQGQLKLANTSVLVVGAGGLGCPAGIYLAAAGLGRIGIVDYDEVELSNLHRQILHTEGKVGVAKSSSAASACSQLNSLVQCVPYRVQLDSSNALQIIKNITFLTLCIYDIVLDASDNVATRYLLNDACILSKKPLVSGSALRFEGQLTVYGYKGGPCYRCLYPKPPPPETVTNCSDGGVLGVVPGIIGSMQALEAIKIACEMGSSFCQKMLLFDGQEGTFRTIKLRSKQPSCIVCGDHPEITELIDYQQFCGARADDKEKSLHLLETENRITVQEYKQILDSGQKHVLIDVRMPVEMEICQLPTAAYNLPVNCVERGDNLASLKDHIQSRSAGEQSFPVYVVCRRGNDSQIAVQKLKNHFKSESIQFKDIAGGLYAWAKHIDINFPVY
ncbi:adenylyltransferase and sulfurtransferase MOCS3-like [Saccostrea echinata]|uniref:adenylyltransferase and sulfurtransferase MOCS3-like n=1 Tax=Saccostrea echinata TaxID=191078 RepID=UPI002A7EE9DD|nr:adenylyltransferase and sulfurtransferase MOCS3-like [Saccostrea echinata]